MGKINKWSLKLNPCHSQFLTSVSFSTFRRQAVIVEPKHVALQSINEDSEGRLVFFMYIQLEQGILTVEVIQNALQVVLYLEHLH